MRYMVLDLRIPGATHILVCDTLVRKTTLKWWGLELKCPHLSQSLLPVIENKLVLSIKPKLCCSLFRIAELKTVVCW